MTVKSFLLVERPETSSNGPGCLCIAIKRTNIAISQKSLKISSKIEKAVKIILAFSPAMDLATCPPSSIAAGNRLSIVITNPTQPANSTGCINGSCPGGGSVIIPRFRNNWPIRIISKGVGKIVKVSGLGAAIAIVDPIAATMVAITKLIIGPLDPTSNSASLFGGSDFCIITAPKVPIPPSIGGGPGIKYGGVA
ncbi:MAG: hypothetical protein QXH37_04480, partial [Candidatus Bathyarchaeia archaeon]